MSLEQIDDDSNEEEDEPEEEQEDLQTTTSKPEQQGESHSDCISKVQSRSTLQPLYVLNKAFKKVASPGSATALIGILNQSKVLLSNLGDSGFVHYRQQDCTIAKKRDSQEQEQTIGDTFLQTWSKEQAHSFNIPYQLAVLPTMKHV